MWWPTDRNRIMWLRRSLKLSSGWLNRRWPGEDRCRDGNHDLRSGDLTMRRRTVLIGFAVTMAAVIGACRQADGDEASRVTIEPNGASPTDGIQEAIDGLGPAGGVIRLSAG